MAIEIVGKDESRMKQATCSSCFSLLRYAPIDVRERWATDYTGWKDKVRFLVCPSCNQEVRV